EAEQERPPVEVGVVAVGELDAGRVALRLERPGRYPRRLPRVGRLEPRLVEEILSPDHGQQDVVDGNTVDPPLDLHRGARGGDPTAVLLADLVVNVGEIGEGRV